MRSTLTSLLTVLAVPAVALAGNFTYNARVLEAEPVRRIETTRSPAASCLTPKPGSFARIIEWDVRCSQPRSVEVVHYQVSYEIEGRHFETLTRTHPGSHIPVRIELSQVR